MLNFSTGARAMISACQTAQVKTILTSRRFVEMGRLTETVAQLARRVNIVYLEDIKAQISSTDRMLTLFRWRGILR